MNNHARQANHLQDDARARASAGAATADHVRLLRLAGGAGDLAVGFARGRLRHQVAIRRVRQFHPAVCRRHLSRLGRRDGVLQPRRRHSLAGARAAVCGADRSRGARQGGLPHAARVALCAGAGGRGRAVVLHLQSDGRRRLGRPAGDGHRLESAAQRHACPVAVHHLGDLEAGELQFPVLSGRPASDPQEPDRSGLARWRRRHPALSHHRLPAVDADDVLPARRQHALRLHRHFGIIHATTGGGPGQATSTLVFRVYRDGFEGLDLGISAAQSVVLLIVIGTLTVLQFRYIERRVEY